VGKTDHENDDVDIASSQGHRSIVLSIVKGDGHGHYKRIVECLCGLQSGLQTDVYFKR
jgi:hypothetical protein